MNIIEDDLSSAAIARLLGEHLADMHEHSPPGSVHALDLTALKADDVTVWSVRQGDELVGCGALKQLDTRHGEVKSMRTARGYLKRGVGSTLLAHIIGEARSRSLFRLSLETGSGAAFEPAHALYRKFGFIDCEPFADYREDPHSRFMSLDLQADANTGLPLHDTAVLHEEGERLPP